FTCLKFHFKWATLTVFLDSVWLAPPPASSLSRESASLDPTVAKRLMELYASGMLPKDEIFTLSCQHIRYQVARLFDAFYFAKDFDTFFKVASWAKKHINPVMFSYTFTLAVLHREDTRAFSIPPPYEVFPSYFVPMDTMHQIYDQKMAGFKQVCPPESKTSILSISYKNKYGSNETLYDRFRHILPSGMFKYNNTGYEHNYHDNMFGGPMSFDVFNPHVDYKVSYFREDVGLNSFYPLSFRFPSWMNIKKYNFKGYFRRGELFYYIHQQMLARYTLERLANGLPFVEAFSYDKPIQVGYNPRIAHFNGEALLARPDDYNLKYSPNSLYMQLAKTAELRLLDAIDYGGFWNATSDSLYNIFNDDGVDVLGNLMLGSLGRRDPISKYYGAYYYHLLEALGYLAKTNNNFNYNGGATTLKISTLRDPAFYNIVVRIVGLFQKLKSHLPFYTSKDLKFPGVSVTNFEVDKLVTYFDMFDFEVTNGVAVSHPKDYIDYKYYASQFRLNHKPFNYKISVNSDAAYDGIVRVFIGPKYDSEEKIMTLNQKRMAMVEIDRFPVKSKFNSHDTT
ncbi:unnamed protein product, partial [Nesidiocoris tenuis]